MCGSLLVTSVWECWKLWGKYSLTPNTSAVPSVLRNVFSVVPRSKVKLAAKMLKAIHAQESKNAAREKAKAVAAQLREMKLKEAAEKVEDSVEETLTYCDFPSALDKNPYQQCH